MNLKLTCVQVPGGYALHVLMCSDAWRAQCSMAADQRYAAARLHAQPSDISKSAWNASLTCRRVGSEKRSSYTHSEFVNYDPHMFCVAYVAS